MLIYTDDYYNTILFNFCVIFRKQDSDAYVRRTEALEDDAGNEVEASERKHRLPATTFLGTFLGATFGRPKIRLLSHKFL